MRILLINPPRTYYKGSEPEVRVGLPLGLLYLSSVIKNKKHDVKIFDCLLTKTKSKETSTFTHGVPKVEVINTIKGYCPGIVGIAAPFTSQVNNTLEIAKIVKAVNKKITVIVGGPHISVDPFIINDKNIDYGLIGEGEYSLGLLLDNNPLEKIPGLIFKQKNKINFNLPKPIENLDCLSLPYYNAVDMEQYFELQKEGVTSRPGLTKAKREISVITSRGCPYGCIFCSIHLHMGKKWRAHSADFVLKHIKYLQEVYNIEHIHFEDDNLTLDKGRFEQILDGLSKLKRKITWDTPNGVRVDSLNKQLLKKMKQTGLTHLFIGVESGDQEVLDKIVNKGISLQKVIDVAQSCKELNIPLSAFFVIGFPGEKEENIKRTIDFSLKLLKEYDVYGPPMFATPLIGTKLYNICKKNNYFARKPTPESYATSTSLSEGRQGMIKTQDFNPEILQEYSDYYIKESQKIMLLKLLKNPFSYLLEKWKK